jgi:hypothetical protein
MKKENNRVKNATPRFSIKTNEKISRVKVIILALGSKR